MRVRPLSGARSVIEGHALLNVGSIMRQWAAGQSYDELIYAYSNSLPVSQSKRLEQSAKYQVNCGRASAAARSRQL